MTSRYIFALRAQLAVVFLLLGAALPTLAQVPAGDVRIHYFRPDGNYSGWALYAWNAATTSYSWCSTEVASSGTDSFGVYFDVPVSGTAGTPAGQLGFILNNCADGQIKDPGTNQYLQVTEYTQGWVVSANPTVFYSQPMMGTNPVPAGDARIHYYRSDGNYTGWGLYAWNAATTSYSWCSSEVAITGIDSFGVYFDLPVSGAAGSPAGQLGLILNNCDNGQTKDPGPNQYLQVTEYSQGWVITGDVTVFYSQPATAPATVPAGDARIHYYRPELHGMGHLRVECSDQ
jgi:pullulanase